MSNDVWAIMETYGVEAGRATIVQQVKFVFGSYGISVDYRHLGLIADYMTHGVRYLAPQIPQNFETNESRMPECQGKLFFQVESCGA